MLKQQTFQKVAFLFSKTPPLKQRFSTHNFQKSSFLLSGGGHGMKNSHADYQGNRRHPKYWFRTSLVHIVETEYPKLGYSTDLIYRDTSSLKMNQMQTLSDWVMITYLQRRRYSGILQDLLDGILNGLPRYDNLTRVEDIIRDAFPIDRLTVGQNIWLKKQLDQFTNSSVLNLGDWYEVTEEQRQHFSPILVEVLDHAHEQDFKFPLSRCIEEDGSYLSTQSHHDDHPPQHGHKNTKSSHQNHHH